MPALQPTTIQSTIQMLQADLPLILPSPPICTLPPICASCNMRLVIGTVPANVVALPPLDEGDICSLFRRPFDEIPALIEKKNKEQQIAQEELRAALNAPEDPCTIRFIPTRDNPLPLDLNAPADQLQVYVRRSPRIREAYNGKRVDPVERASRRIAASVESISSSSSHSSKTKSWPKKKLKKLEDIVQLPITKMPCPTSAGKLKELADFYGLDGHKIIEEAQKLDNEESCQECDG
ncbi:hypothetical protein E2562_030583 [Oryza meyeriana var. granulata]|uniref:Uncharacterized protein n=1 Tax=Oryza meyeriana var. granulata TaxID=110450 RepID=A0A6G1ER73_9ORYZ|nr:hypothetical protein E2562_030583 [Oryza meyeriana var. granulata]